MFEPAAAHALQKSGCGVLPFFFLRHALLLWIRPKIGTVGEHLVFIWSVAMSPREPRSEEDIVASFEAASANQPKVKATSRAMAGPVCPWLTFVLKRL